MTHVLKAHAPYFEALWTRQKTAEMRLDNRGFTVGDFVHLTEMRAGVATGRFIVAEITHILRDSELLKKGYVMLSLDTIGMRKEPGA